MPFLIECTARGCCELQAPYIDLDTDKVYCSKCDQEINNISIFTKRQMKSLKQVRQKEKKSFSVKCSYCNKEDRPKILNDEIVCSFCSKIIDNLSVFFKNMLKTQLQTIDKESKEK